MLNFKMAYVKKDENQLLQVQIYNWKMTYQREDFVQHDRLFIFDSN
ncbi:hypothetical protein [Bacillus sp. MRMR6]|nr:hypothetical protein [Bacillus sp. MRMR6]